jgi:hypothetical protein
MANQEIIDAAVEVFGLGPEHEDDVLRFAMKLEDGRAMTDNTAPETLLSVILYLDANAAPIGPEKDRLKNLAAMAEKMEGRLAALEGKGEEPTIQTQDMLTRGEAQQLVRNMRERCQTGQCDASSSLRSLTAAAQVAADALEEMREPDWTQEYKDQTIGHALSLLEQEGVTPK